MPSSPYSWPFFWRFRPPAAAAGDRGGGQQTGSPQPPPAPKPGGQQPTGAKAPPAQGPGGEESRPPADLRGVEGPRLRGREPRRPGIGGPSYTSSATFKVHAEDATLSADSTIRIGPAFGARGGLRVWKNLAVGAGFQVVSTGQSSPSPDDCRIRSCSIATGR